ncbi:nucleoside triphosphate pyrophosphatase [Sphingosinicella ginsenosidimutans]|uniref:Nucleoside triphosphate pyrophosphatase n=1 Tax=Allosphingosinicella ginsenosidimutans TaxID=1176539 RepID=A0A5C6TSD3_9SPHN|nr:Maf family protein [Sphingosinicella ginsenosidimutans]TXC63283.1 septum formation protein Maf [Sphingosinicella ginsenosidimutans]
MRLLLASRSETRRRMLAAAGVPFECVDTPFDEEAAKRALAGLDARATADALAAMKAESVIAPGALTLGADQTLELADGSILGKPESREALAAQLRSMRGDTHRLHSAVVAVEDGAPVWRACESVALTVRRFSDAFIAAYVDAEYESVRWNAGGYRIEGPGAQLFGAIEGSHFAILGLPLLPLLDYLRARGILEQ